MFPLSNMTGDTMTTIQVNSEGDFAEDSLTDADTPKNADVLSDLYVSLIKGSMDERDFSIQTLAYEALEEIFGDSTDSDSDTAKWCKIGSRNDSPEELRLIEKPSDMDSEPNLGRYFWKATGYTANDYTKYEDRFHSDVDIRPLDDVNDEGETFKSILQKFGIVESDETVNVPVNSEGELIPPFVVSDDREVEGLTDDLPSYEEGIERLVQLQEDHFGETSEVVEDSDDDKDDESEDADGLLRGANGVGAEVSEDIRKYIVENRTTIDWRNHIDGKEWHEAPTVVSKDEARDRLQQVALDMDSEDFQKAMSLIEEGETEQAMMAVEQYE